MTSEAWTGRAFRDEVTAWVQRELAVRGARLTGERMQARVRPWSSTLRFTTTDGPVWFKVDGPGSAYEPSLVAQLAARVPDLVPEVLAVDPGRGWSLTSDAGPVLREALPLAGQWAAWTELLPRYAEAQLLVSADPQALLSSGLPDLTPGALPALARDLVESLARTAVDAGGLAAADVAALESWCRRLEDWCARLSSRGVPDSVQHDDLHSANVCWGGSAAAARVIDWGDASWGSPLGTLLVTLNAVADANGVTVDSPAVRRLRDAYLEPFTPYADRAALVELGVLARRAGCVARALSWRRALQGEATAAHAEHGFPVRGWLRQALEVERE